MTENIPADGEALDPLADEHEDGSEEADVETSQGVAHQYSEMPDGTYLILSGPGAGTVVMEPPDGAVMRPTPAVPSRDEALDDGRPLLMIHRPHQAADVIPRLMANIYANGAGNFALGTILPIPAVSPQSRDRWAAACPTAAVKIADPRGFVLDPTYIRLEDEPVKSRMETYAPYLATVGANDWVAQVLDAQRGAGANLLLTSGRALNTASPQPALDAASDEGDDALAELQDGERLALNLTLNADWLTNPALLNALLAHLVDQEQFDTWYIRVQWRGLRAHQQPSRAELLAGYRELAEVAEDEDRNLLLPQTGLTGWFLLAFGATGFGTGVDGSHNAFGEPGGGGGGQPRIERYFERQLLHTVERTVHDQLVGDPGYQTCTCIYCRALLAPSRPWDHRLAGLHYLSNLGYLTAGAGQPTAPGGARGYIRRSVRRASRFSEGKMLASTNAPSHLRAWGRAL